MLFVVSIRVLRKVLHVPNHNDVNFNPTSAKPKESYGS